MGLVLAEASGKPVVQTRSFNVILIYTPLSLATNSRPAQFSFSVSPTPLRTTNMTSPLSQVVGYTLPDKPVRDHSELAMCTAELPADTVLLLVCLCRLHGTNAIYLHMPSVSARRMMNSNISMVHISLYDTPELCSFTATELGKLSLSPRIPLEWSYRRSYQ